MFDHANVATAATPAAAAVRELRRLGLHPAVAEAGGTAVAVSVRRVLSDRLARTDFLERLAAAASGGSVCAAAGELGREREAIDNWHRFCQILADWRRDRDACRAGIATSLAAHWMPAEACCLIADAVLGRGERYLLLDDLQFTPCTDSVAREMADRLWRSLWQRRACARRPLPVYGGLVRSACPLLSDELAATVLPASGLQIPAGSAWLRVGVPLPEFADPGGKVDRVRLRRHLADGLAIADTLLDSIARPVAAPGGDDARLNRRLAFDLGGIGDVVVAAGDDPADLGTLRRMQALVTEVRETLECESARLAGDRGMLQALADADPGGAFDAAGGREAWNRVWQDALCAHGVRHRNLLTLSPYAVLPRGDRCPPAFADLLPVLAGADAWRFSAAPAMAGWSLEEYRHFHRRAWAVTRGSRVTAFVAAGA